MLKGEREAGNAFNPLKSTKQASCDTALIYFNPTECVYAKVGEDKNGRLLASACLGNESLLHITRVWCASQLAMTIFNSGTPEKY